MAKKANETTPETPAESPAEAEVTLIVTPVDAPPEVRFRLKPNIDDVSLTLGSKTLEFAAGETYGCTRGEWAALAGTGCFDLVE